ncbi:hypothetical protein V8G54_016585, partial [Vigna mungo]
AVEGDSGAIDGEAVEGLGPPLVGGDAEAGNGRGVVGEKEDLLRESEERNDGARSSESGKGSVAERVRVVGEFASVVVAYSDGCFRDKEQHQNQHHHGTPCPLLPHLTLSFFPTHSLCFCFLT